MRSLSPESGDVAAGLSDLAAAELLSGDLDAAERDYREALQIVMAVNKHEGITVLTGNLALRALDRKDWLNAEALAHEDLTLSEQVGRKELIASVCRRLAEALTRQGRKTETLPHARRAVEIYTALRSPELEWAQQTLAECES